MCTGKEKPVSGRQKFLELYARLKSGLRDSRIRDTASRYDRLSEDHRRIIFLLANEASARFCGVPHLSGDRLRADFDELSETERQSLMLGIKCLAELAAALPWEFPDHAAPRYEFQRYLEIQAQRKSSPSAPDSAIN
ncbi:hypothetical protein [Pantoea ananatis]|uniref:hypothetical protein n=1 Tax=Pantoea ananas TaxID=553 RepID=UPI001B311AAA|nr:hypothetical protein [Pantoea ananatis]